MARKKDCKGDGCGVCQVCRYFDWLEWVSAVAPRDIPCTIQRNTKMEAYLDKHYPHWRD